MKDRKTAKLSASKSMVKISIFRSKDKQMPNSARFELMRVMYRYILNIFPNILNKMPQRVEERRTHHLITSDPYLRLCRYRQHSLNERLHALASCGADWRLPVAPTMCRRCGAPGDVPPRRRMPPATINGALTSRRTARERRHRCGETEPM